MIHKRNYLFLKQAKTKPDLAAILGITSSFLTKVLYKQGVDVQYHQFEIKKKSGGTRTINAPSGALKDIQQRLSKLLLDCLDVIRVENKIDINCILSHGFERKRTIYTNASVHKGKNNVLNLDLEDFFGSFNFGRVRGYFIANRHFQLDPHIATVIAQIACYKNELPQGSPCSPVISNLITGSLDIRLSRLARKSGCAYSRYADDITFSTSKTVFPKLILEDSASPKLGSKLMGEIRRAGFSVNNKKTRLQCKNSRQETTGLITNKKVNVKPEYWRLTRAMAFNQFKTGSYEIHLDDGSSQKGSLAELEGRLAFIDDIDFQNNLIKKKTPNPPFDPPNHKGKFAFRQKLNSRESVYSRFLHYKWFYENKHPTILTEGKTDNVYLKSALSLLQASFPDLVIPKTPIGQYKPKLYFPNLNRKTMYLLDLGDGATPFVRFVSRYALEQQYFHGNKAQSPVILILDNDDGPKALLNHLAKNVTSCKHRSKSAVICRIST